MRIGDLGLGLAIGIGDWDWGLGLGLWVGIGHHDWDWAFYIWNYDWKWRIEIKDFWWYSYSTLTKSMTNLRYITLSLLAYKLNPFWKINITWICRHLWHFSEDLKNVKDNQWNEDQGNHSADNIKELDTLFLFFKVWVKLEMFNSPE